MRLLARVAITCVYCLLSFEQSPAQHAVHAEDNLGVDDDPPVATTRCVDVPVEVTARSADERGLVCSAASRALQMLGHCEIHLHRRLHVQVTNDVVHPVRGVVLGLFDSQLEKILVTREENIPYLIGGTPFGILGQRDLYKSLIVHEVVHGVMHQNFAQNPTGRAVNEYPAYALQLASLPAGKLKKYLDSVDKSGGGEFLFNDLVLSLDSFFFAARAYRHFASSSDGCSQLRSILAGNATFIATSLPL